MSFRSAPHRRVGGATAPLTLVALVLFAATACGSGNESASTTTAPAETTTTTSTTVADPDGDTPDGPDAPAEPSAPEDPEQPATSTDGDPEPPDTTTEPDGSSEPLRDPSGTFLSSHRLSLSGAGAPDRGRSVCRTTAGATCTIAFTRDGQTRELPPRTTDSSGTAEWDWSPAEIGLSPGHWDVRITASRGDQQRSVREAMGLEVID